jgi:hypothetical protein
MQSCIYGFAEAKPLEVRQQSCRLYSGDYIHDVKDASKLAQSKGFASNNRRIAIPA